MRGATCRRAFALLLAVAASGAGFAQAATEAGVEPAQPADAPAPAEAALEAVVVTATRDERRAFELPAAVGVVDRAVLQQTPRTGLMDVLARIPGALAIHRGTFAQEEQIVIRGFGARSQFGVRGIRLLVDGIPASTPDGQGGSGMFDLASSERIEVLRGPFSALYGNHSGGVVQIFTERAAQPPEWSALLAGGSFGSRRAAAKASGRWDAAGVVVSLSRLDTDGHRDWSSARKDQFNAKLHFAPLASTRVTVLANRLDQPDNLDPLGLSAAQMAADRRQANPAALAFRTRRNLENRQAGVAVEHELANDRSLRVVAYAGTRSNEQFLAFPGSGATSSGGVSAFERDFRGINLRYTQRVDRLRFTVGVDHERADDRRSGYVNDAGVRGALRRDEENRVTQTGVYAQAEWNPSAAWSLHGGVRRTRVAFDSDDRYVAGINPDDSGSADFSAWTPTAGVVRHLNDAVNLYASVGRSFETPTFIELAYRPGGAIGLNFDLQPSISRHAEAGVKAKLGAGTSLEAALFRIDTRDEIVVDSNVGGRTSYRNAGDTRRIGVEATLETRFADDYAFLLVATWLDARFRDDFAGSGGLVASGNRIPGVPARTVFTELAWRPPATGFSAALEGRWTGRIEVDDRNTESADRWFAANLRAGWKQRAGAWEFRQFVRVENLFDGEYVGAVYVNDGNGRFYAPASGRAWLVGASATRVF